MSQSGFGEPSSQKLHPFFTKDSSSGQVSSQPFPVEARESATETRDGSLPTNKQKSDYAQCEHVGNTESLQPRHADDVSIMAGLVQPLHNPETGPMELFQNPNSTKRHAIPTATGFSNHAPVAAVTTSKLVSRPSSERRYPESNGSSGQKVLKFNAKTGTLGSPPKTKQKSKPSLLVCIRYGRDEASRTDVGEKITQILNGTLQLPKTPRKSRSTRKQIKSTGNSSNQSSSTSKSTHPFFTGKSKPRSSTPSHADPVTKSPPRKNSVFMSTPVSPRRQRNPFLSASSSKMPQFGIKSGGTKVPGSKYPMWPPKSMSHVQPEDYLPLAVKSQGQEALDGYRKSKGQVTTVGASESVLRVVMEHLDIGALRRSLPQDDDSFVPAPPELRIPQRHFESGRKLQQRLRPQLSITSPWALSGKEDISQDELAGPAPPVAHSAISRHYLSLSTHLSAYDRSTCESIAWSQKYAPVSAVQVLQNGKDALHIKQWLEAMKVQSVETSNGDSTGKSKTEAAPKKKRKKNKEDDFIVDTDNEESELEEISENDEKEAGSVPIFGKSKKSVVRSGNVRSKELGRLKNTIIISGPHGCGKTAAVYAIAKELDFEIFEINSSSRRCGKDILEKVGDMTRNHLVQQHRAQPHSLPSPAGNQLSNETPGKEPSKSGTQGTMTAFFKTKPEQKQPKISSTNTSTSQTRKGTSLTKAQKQSLILIEEADILYDEDKQFWATLIGMMSQSRRPFVVTCNDESLVPLQSLNLHGIFRFAPVPSPLAVDLCLLIAGNEGHALGRSAVEGLYRSRNHDLRATITDLNFWCQIGVGDRRGGFDWFYSRWPKGCDLDQRGDVVRVVSEDTYQYGMGWVGRDAISSECDGLDRELEALQQSWDCWQVDMGDWCQSAEMGTLAKDMWIAAASCGKQSIALEAFDNFHQTQSDADLLAGGIFATSLQEPVDPTVPDLAVSARDDFIVGRTLLDAEAVSHHTAYSKTISLALKSEARRQLDSDSQKVRLFPDGPRLRSVDESRVLTKLDALFSSHSRDMTRMDIAYAFDPIAVAPKTQPTSYLDPSVFDRTMRLIVTDVAPWVRGIVAFEHQLMQERLKLGIFLGEGGTRKRMRNTRSAYSALEGGERKSTRKERYFGDALDTSLVMRTGGHLWQDMVAESMQGSQQCAESPREEMDMGS
ncbi:hypothetical protein QQS21_009764 [Conoideocrella luteorostrata]|uniref:AAA+ ATPase domain-containing protein n=1 Tax=Conoideocrella luteorostrata TaxID=1105319 RepID=A0AAJ0CJ22_9HYPO|nr:hypothetical protein QQS21_009764 [Conoideocrella luteorostrata]